uniref:Uncharacterized protein n=1 Tax=Rhizophora mucronata TaxID=61149 RepID=A0A2P2NUW5_RHIMU
MELHMHGPMTPVLTEVTEWPCFDRLMVFLCCV